MPNERPFRLPAAVGLTQGAQGEAVGDLQEYLRRFGYLKEPAPSPDDPLAPRRAASRAPRATENTFDNATRTALRRFQQFTGLPVTGVLDDATVAQMSRPRCGFPDLPDGGDGPARFTAQGSRWNTTALTFGFQNFCADLTQAQTRAAVVAALNLWSAATPLRFTEAANPNIVIRFVAGNHGDGAANAFDGTGGTFAHAYYPPPGGGGLAGDAHFDEDEMWTVAIPVPAGGTDLLTVAAHEFGHSLGLAHSSVAGALMFPFYSGPHRFLSPDDLQGIQSIYGSRVLAVPGWFGAEDQGADIAIADINGNGRPDLVVFHIDNPGGENHGYYRVGWNLGMSGDVTGGWSPVKRVPGWFGAEDQGAGIAIADLNRNGRPDLVVFHVDNPGGENRGYYRVGCDLNANGDVTGGWTAVKPVPGWFGWENQGAAIAIADISGNGRPDIIVFHLDNPHGDNHGYYRIGWNLDGGGNVTGGWSPVRQVPGWFGWENQGAGIAIADVDGSGRPDLVVFHIDNPGGENHGYYRVGRNLDTNGNVTGGWGPVIAVPGWFGAEDQGAGIATADVNGSGRPDLVVFHVDNPGGENHGYYRVLFDV